MVTQRDIAKKAGLTQMTVSRALRGATDVSEETVRRVRALAEEMGYAPNPLVSSLMRTRRGRGGPETGLSIAWHGFSSALRKRERGRSDFCDPYDEMLQGAREACRRNGFGLEVFAAGERDDAMPRILKARGIRGLVLGPIGYRAKRGIDVSKIDGVHIVRMARDHREAQFDRVVSNAYEEMRMCVEVLYGAGCRRIGYIDNEGHERISEGRWKGAFQSIGLDLGCICTPSFPNYGTQAIPPYLEAYLKEHRPDGLVVGGRSFIKAMVDRPDKDRVPFVCVERNAWPDWVSGAETNFRQIGIEAAQFLINRILSPHAPEDVRKTIAVHSTWHEGTSHLKRTTD